MSNLALHFLQKSVIFWKQNIRILTIVKIRFPIHAKVGEMRLLVADIEKLILILRNSQIAFFIDIGLKRAEWFNEHPQPDIELLIIEFTHERKLL